MPFVPFNPTATMTTEARISVISVMPLTGLEPTMAMALAATVVKRKAMTIVSIIATNANSMLPSMTPNQKKSNVHIIVVMAAMAINLKLRSRSVRLVAIAASLLPPFISLAASPTALLIMPHDLMMPIIPDMAMAPMPMLLP